MPESILDERLERCCRQARSLLERLSAEMQQLPRPQTMFVGNAERTHAYAETCRVLLCVEKSKAALQKAIAELLVLDEQLLRAPAYASLEYADLRTKCHRACEAWLGFYGKTLSAFFERIRLAADMSGEGSRCNPVAVAELCRTLCRSIELFLTQQDF